MAFGRLFVFADVFRSEIESINKRRAELGRRRANFSRPPIALEDEKAPDGTPLVEQFRVAGLAAVRVPSSLPRPE